MSDTTQVPEKGTNPFNRLAMGGPEEKIAHALEYIAAAMERIDHNLARLTGTFCQGVQKEEVSRKPRSPS